jgi:membrane protein implicated in regulation of membrane protease activity
MEKFFNVVADMIAIVVALVLVGYTMLGLILLIIIYKIEITQVLGFALLALYVIWRLIRDRNAKSISFKKPNNRNIRAAIIEPIEDVDAATQLERDKAEWDRILSQ